MESWNKIIETVISNKIYLTIAIAIIGSVIYKVIEKTINGVIERDKEKHRLDRKSKTVFKLIINIIKYVIFAIVMVLILQIHGVNVNSLVAGLGLVSVIAGLAIQDPIKDIISGMHIVSDEYFSIGDVVQIDGIEGKVIELDVRTTKIKAIKDGNILTIANRNISKAIKVSEELYLDVPLSYDEKPENVEKILEDIVSIIQKVENVNNAKYLGIGSFEDSYINYKIEIWCKPEFKLTVKRMANTIIKLELDKKGISIPYPQLTIHGDFEKGEKIEK